MVERQNQNIEENTEFEKQYINSKLYYSNYEFIFKTEEAAENALRIISEYNKDLLVQIETLKDGSLQVWLRDPNAKNGKVTFRQNKVDEFSTNTEDENEDVIENENEDNEQAIEEEDEQKQIKIVDGVILENEEDTIDIEPEAEIKTEPVKQVQEQKQEPLVQEQEQKKVINKEPSQVNPPVSSPAKNNVAVKKNETSFKEKTALELQQELSKNNKNKQEVLINKEMIDNNARKQARKSYSEPLETEAYDIERDSKKSKFKGNGMMYIIGVIAIIISYAVGSFQFAGLARYKADITRLENDFVAVRKDISDLKAQVVNSAATITGYDAKLNTAINNSNTKVNDALSKLDLNDYVKEQEVETLSDTIKSLNTTIVGLTAKVESSNNLINNYITSNNTKNTDITKVIDALKFQLIADEKLLADITTKLASINAALETLTTKVNAVSGTGTGTGSTAGVTVSTTANPITGLTTMNFSPTSTSNSFNFTLSNNTGNQIKNIQLAIGFVFMNSNGTTTLDLPVGTTSSLTTLGLTPVWANQSSPDRHTLIFATQSATGLLASLYAFNQGTGNATYTVTLTLSGTAITENYLVYPIIKVVSFSTN